MSEHASLLCIVSPLNQINHIAEKQLLDSKFLRLIGVIVVPKIKHILEFLNEVIHHLIDIMGIYEVKKLDQLGAYFLKDKVGTRTILETQDVSFFVNFFNAWI